MKTVSIQIKNGKTYTVPTGDSLFSTLRGVRVFIPTVCGGKGFCGQCKLKILEGVTAAHTASELKKLTDEERATGWRLSCQVTVENDMLIELPEAIQGIEMFTATVREAEMVSPDIRRIRLELDESTSIDYLPGAFCLFDIPPSAAAPRGVSRCYSIATPPSSKNTIEINVKRVPNGIGSGYMHDILKAGDTVTFTGPNSGYANSTDTNELICVAGGSGMSPVLSILHHLNEIKSTRTIRYFFGVNTASELLYMDELHALEQELPNFQFIPVIYEPNADFTGETGSVVDAVKRCVSAESVNASAYLCGSPGLLNACCEVLTPLGISGNKVFFDKFS